MSLDLVLHAPLSRVWHVITDYADIKRLNPAVKSSAVIRRDGITLLRMRIKSCVLFICFPITQTESMTSDGHLWVQGVIVPQLSSFRSGVSRWQLRAVEGGTEAHFSASLTPSFYIPPVIGPWMVRRKLRAEMRATASHLRAWVYAKAPHKA
ncbi:MAG: SRPBCC family protein [Acidiferrobacter sp.]